MFLRALVFSMTLWLMAGPVLAQSAKPHLIEEELDANFDLRCTLKRRDAKRKEAAAATGPALLLGYKSGAAQLSLNFAPDGLHLSRKLNGKTVVLASVRQFYALPEKEIPLVVQWRNGSLRVIYDRRTILRREGLGVLHADAALAATGGDYEFAGALCQPVEPVAFADDFMRAAGDAGQWEKQTGEWKIRSAADPSKVANAFTYVGQGKPAIALAGRWFWDDYRMGVAVRPAGQSIIGLVAYWQDAQNYILFRWLPEDDESAPGREKQLWRVWRGQRALLATAPGACRAKQWYHLAINVGGGLVTVAVDGQRVLQKRTDLFGQGKVGLYASGEQPVLVDDVTVDHAPTFNRSKIARSEAITPQFTKEQSMESWASPKSEWLPTTTAGETVFWNRGTFFGDHALELKATALQQTKVTATICGDGNTLSSGYSLVTTRTADGKNLESILMRGGKAVTKTHSSRFDAQSIELLRLERAGPTVLASIGKETVAAFTDSRPLAGNRAGYAVQGAPIERSEARVSGGNLYDYTFYRAPIDWYVSGGTWDMTNRWDCTPTWSWYGGWGDRVAAIWNKHSFGGDFVIDLFAACKRDVGGYLHPRDINITVAGDGRDLASGYSFIFGGWNNTATRIMRGTQQVAETTKVLLPKNYEGEAHRKWFNLRVERTGNTISCYVDRELALRYQDPKPLPGRHIALWTCGNGVMIARATLYYQQEMATEPVPLLIDNRGWNTLAVEKLGWTARGKDASLRLDAVGLAVPLPQRRATRVAVAKTAVAKTPIVRAVNLEGGGPFAIVPELEAFDALKLPGLSFDCFLEKGAAVNLYLRVKGVMHSVRLTGPAKEMELEATKVLGAVQDVRADNQWHRISLDLAALLKPLYPNDPEIRVEEIFLGNLSRDIYQQAGFGANPPGATYLVRSFALRGTDNRIAKTIEPRLKSASSATRIAAAPPLLPNIQAPVVQAPIAPPASSTTPPEAVAPRGLLNLRVTYCQDADGGEFKQEMLNKPIEWRCFSRPLVTTKVDAIDFNWADKAPASGLRSKYWSARFFGKLMVPKQGDYTFSLERLDDGARLYIDGKPIIESWRIQAATSQESKPIALTPGAHDIRLDYSQGSGLGSLTLRWSGPDFAKEIVTKAAAPTIALAKLNAR